MTSPPHRVLIASDKFKGSLSSAGAAEALAVGIQGVAGTFRVDAVPISDGGDGLHEIALSQGFEQVPVSVSGPLGTAHDAHYARREDCAVAEMATLCGMGRLPVGSVGGFQASSRGLGEAMCAALDAGCRSLIIGAGGSASTDGGAGMLAALGAVGVDEHGVEVQESGLGALSRVARLDLARLHPGLREAQVTVLSDVDSPLAGPVGAVRVFGPQKGMRADELSRAEALLEHWADVVESATGAAGARHLPGAGCAGGIGFGALAVLESDLRAGAEFLLDWLGLPDRIRDADVVITGEGSLDHQSLYGKAPLGVARLARASGVPAIVVCGRNSLSDDEVRAAGIAKVYSLASYEPDLALSMRDAARLLGLVGADIARSLSAVDASARFLPPSGPRLSIDPATNGQ